jgi:hypothetical protein
MSSQFIRARGNSDLMSDRQPTGLGCRRNGARRPFGRQPRNSNRMSHHCHHG